MRLLGTFGRTRSENWSDGGNWLLFTLIGGLLPVWGGAIILVLFGNEVSFASFTDHGEFAIYSAGLLASALLVVMREYRARFRERAILGLLSLVLIIIATLIFTAASAGENETTLNVNRTIMRNASVTLYCITVILTFFLTVLKEALEPRLEEISRTGALEDRFDELGGDR